MEMTQLLRNFPNGKTAQLWWNEVSNTSKYYYIRCIAVETFLSGTTIKKKGGMS